MSTGMQQSSDGFAGADSMSPLAAHGTGSQSAQDRYFLPPDMRSEDAVIRCAGLSSGFLGRAAIAAMLNRHATPTPDT